MFNARCTTEATGLGATETYDVREMCYYCCWLHVAASYQTTERVKKIGRMTSHSGRES